MELLLAVLASVVFSAEPPAVYTITDLRAFRDGRALVTVEARVSPVDQTDIPLPFLSEAEASSFNVLSVDGEPLQVQRVGRRVMGAKEEPESGSFGSIVSSRKDLPEVEYENVQFWLTLPEPKKKVQLRMSYISTRFSWSPWYRVVLSGDGKARVELWAELRNGLGDLSSTPVSFMFSERCQANPGFPQPPYPEGGENPGGEAMTPATAPAPGDCTCADQLAYGQYGYLANQSPFVQDVPVEASGGDGSIMPLDPSGLAYPSVELSMGVGERARVQVASFDTTAALVHLVNSVDTFSPAKVSKALSLLNPARGTFLVPGRVEVFSGERYLASGCLPAAGPRSMLYVPLGESDSLKAEFREHAGEGRTVESANVVLEEYPVSGKVILTNCGREEIRVFVRRLLEGRHARSNDLEVSQYLTGDRVAFLLWKELIIPPDTSTELKFNLERLKPIY